MMPLIFLHSAFVYSAALGLWNVCLSTPREEMYRAFVVRIQNIISMYIIWDSINIF